MRIIDNLLTNRSGAAEVEHALFAYLAEIKALVKGIAILRELTPRSMDAICSYGERLSSRIIAAALAESGAPAAWVDAREFMITDDAFGRAQPMMDAVADNLERKVRPMLSQGIVPVTQGFIGVTTGGSYTTMGRESSDYSASIIGAAMNAARVQIWTDVDGILTADPRLVPHTLNVRSMTFEEAFELSYFGAKVLHPATMLPVLERAIPVQILNSKRPGGSGTWVDAAARVGEGSATLKSIAYRRNVTLLTIAPRKRVNQFLFWESLYSVFGRLAIPIAMSASSEYSLALAIDGAQVTEQLLHELNEFGLVNASPGKASLCLVGGGLRGAPGVCDRVFRALSPFGVSMISAGASGSSMTLLVEDAEIPAALQRLHAEFFDRAGTDGPFEAPGR